MKTITIEELEKLNPSEITIIDVRPAEQYQRGSFPEAQNLPLDVFEEEMEKIDTQKPVYV